MRLLARGLSGILFLSVFASPCLVSAADGEKSEKGPAFTEPPVDDDAYELMGEFVGAIDRGEGKKEELALQIRPVADNTFDAVTFYGGLPGQPEHRSESIRMTGRGSGEFVVLSGGPWAIFVETDHCLIVNRKGKPLGRLKRVHRSSPTLGAQPPIGSIVMFDGTNTDMFTSGEMTAEGLLTHGSDFKPMFQDFNLHVEFRLPYMPRADGQQRSNSGLYLQSRYECQVLDSFATPRLFNGLGSLYRTKAPDLNMALPPLVWQTYDVMFTAPRWASDGSKMRNARISSWVNGVVVQDNVELMNKTGAGKEEEPTLLPIRLQDHGDPVRFRNIWVIDRGVAPPIKFPVLAADNPPVVNEEPVEASVTEKSNDEKKMEAVKPAEPAKSEPAKSEPAKSEPAKTEPAKTEPAKTEPAKTEPAKTEPAKTEPAKTEPAE